MDIEQPELEKLPVLPKEAVTAVYQAALQEQAYWKAARERPEGIRGLFARIPREPWPELSAKGIDEVLSAAVRGAYPELNRTAPGPAGPESYTASFSVSMKDDGSLGGYFRSECRNRNTFHAEFFEYRDGYGLRHAYSHSDDRERDAANRGAAYASAMNGRYRDIPFFVRTYKALDGACNEFRSVVEAPPMRRREIRSLLGRVAAYAEALAAREEKIRDYQERFATKYAFTGLRSFVEGTALLAQLKADAARRGDSSDEMPIASAQYRAVEKNLVFACSRTNAADKTVRMADDIAHLCAMALPSKDPFRKYGWTAAEVLEYAKLHYENSTGLNPEGPENARAFLDEYARIARMAGLDLNDISSAASEEALRSGIGTAVRDVAHSVLLRVNELDKERLIALDRRIRDLVAAGETVSLEKAMEPFKAEFPAMVARDRAAAAAAPLLRELDLDMEGMGAARALGKRIHDWNAKVGFDAAADALAVATERNGYGDRHRVAHLRNEIIRGYEGRLVEEYALKEGSLADTLGEIRSASLAPTEEKGEFEKQRRTTSGPQAVLAADIAMIADTLSRTDPESLGPFLRDAGVRFTRGASMAWDLRDAAAKLYGDGGGEAALRVEALRTRWEKPLSEAKRSAAAPAREKSRETKSNLSI